jgi:hypothetical protein
MPGCRSLKTAFDAIATTTLKDVINDLMTFVKNAPQLLRDLAERLHQTVRKIWTYDGCDALKLFSVIVQARIILWFNFSSCDSWLLSGFKCIATHDSRKAHTPTQTC